MDLKKPHMYTRIVTTQIRPTRTSFGRYSSTVFLRLRSHCRAVSVPFTGTTVHKHKHKYNRNK